MLDQYTFLIISRSILRMRSVSDKSCKENQNILRQIFFRKSCRLWGNVDKYCTVGEATDDKMRHAHCMLDTKR